MVYFLYFSVYPQREDYEKLGALDGRPRFNHHLLLRDLATKFVLPVLALLAKEHFIKALEKDWDIYIFYDCIPVIYGEQPEPDSTLRKIAAQKMKLNLEWDAERRDLWDDFHRYVQNFPLFACGVLAALYPMPTPKPGLTLEGGMKGSWDIESGRSIFKRPLTPISTGLVKRALGHWPIFLDESGRRYDAVLFQTNPRGTNNEYCCLQIFNVYVVALAKKCSATHVRYGKVGESETDRALVKTLEGRSQHPKKDTEYLSDDVELFEEKFKDLTGLDWADRSNQPVKSKYSYIGDRGNDVPRGWYNAVSKPL